jgi:hypothetical protein
MPRAASGNARQVAVSHLPQHRAPAQTVFLPLLPSLSALMEPNSAFPVPGAIQPPWATTTLGQIGRRHDHEVGVGSQCAHRVVTI